MSCASQSDATVHKYFTMRKNKNIQYGVIIPYNGPLPVSMIQCIICSSSLELGNEVWDISTTD